MLGCHSFVRHFTDGGYTKAHLIYEALERKKILIKYKPRRQIVFMLIGEGRRKSKCQVVPIVSD
jgi:hypothetical protein